MADQDSLPKSLTLVLSQDQIVLDMTAIQFCLTFLGEEDLETKISLAHLHRDIVAQVEEQVAESLKDDE